MSQEELANGGCIAEQTSRAPGDGHRGGVRAYLESVVFRPRCLILVDTFRAHSPWRSCTNLNATCGTILENSDILRQKTCSKAHRSRH